jgi:hypothetical protein
MSEALRGKDLRRECGQIHGGTMNKRLSALCLLIGLWGVAWVGGKPGPPVDPMKDAVLKTVKTFTDGMIKHDFAAISSAWHENGRLFIVEDMQMLDFLKNIPPFVKFEFDQSEVLSLDTKIAVVRIEWRMIMPKTVGYHKSYLNLIEQNGKWLIISETDYGVEKED